jgi:hypothetical protein
MAYYQDPVHVKPMHSRNFDEIHKPGAKVVVAGLYRCEQCGFEEPLMDGEDFPADGHQHSIVNQGPIRWQLVVQAERHPA